MDELTFEEVVKLALSVFPKATIMLDNDGEWVVYTAISEKEE